MSRDEVRAHDRAIPPRDLLAGARAIHDEEMAEELVPALAPELGYGHGQPGAVRDAGPLCQGLAEHDLADQRAELVHDVDGGVDKDHAADRDGQHVEKVREWVEGIVVNGVAFGTISSRTDELHHVVRGVERRYLDQELEKLVGDRPWWVGIIVERLG